MKKKFIFLLTLTLCVNLSKMTAQHAFSPELSYNWTSKKTFYRAGGDTTLSFRYDKSDGFLGGLMYQYSFGLFSLGTKIGIGDGQLRHWSINACAHPLETFDGVFVTSGLVLKPRLGFNIGFGVDININEDETLKLSPMFRYGIMSYGKYEIVGSERWQMYELSLSLKFVIAGNDD
ncbi:MAG: hypothetical protein RL757_1223 [Bacteroidota bacterium]